MFLEPRSEIKENKRGRKRCGCCRSKITFLDVLWLCQTDIDECALRTASCYGTDDVCINTRGGYKCQTVTCPKGFVKSTVSGSRNKWAFHTCTYIYIIVLRPRGSQPTKSPSYHSTTTCYLEEVGRCYGTYTSCHAVLGYVLPWYQGSRPYPITRCTMVFFYYGQP